VLVTLESLQATLAGGVSLTIGEGARAITMRFGSDTIIQGDVIRRFIDEARNALMNSAADVVLRVEDVSFQSGHDLESFLEKQKLDVAPGEVQQ